MKLHLLALAALAFLPACGSLQERLAELSAPEISCAQSDVEISETFSTRSASRYKASCSDGKVYRCISMGKPFGDDPETTCQPVSGDDAVASSAGASEAGIAPPRGVLPGGWPRVRVNACQAELTMPPDARLFESVEPTQNITMREARAHAGGSAFGFSCAELPQLAAAPDNADEVVEGAVNGALQAIEGDLITSRKLRDGTGRSLLIRVKGAKMAMRVWTQGQWLYSASVVPIDSLPDGAVAEYLDRITVPASTR
jgi:hypothetical protein